MSSRGLTVQIEAQTATMEEYNTGNCIQDLHNSVKPN